jgi:superfamily II DNA or RNA helicase
MLITMDESLQRTQNRAYTDFVKQAADYKEAGKKHTDSLVAELRYRQSAELLKVPTLAEYAQDYMSEGLSVCIFVNYRATLAALSKVLDTRSLIFGDQDRMKISREDVILDFQSNKSRIILLMSDAGGQSIDLHDLHGGHQRISLICPTYNPITLKQVMGRTHRAKSKTIPIIKLVYSAGTVEEKVAESVAGKLDNIEALNKGDMMEPDIFNIAKMK